MQRPGFALTMENLAEGCLFKLEGGKFCFWERKKKAMDINILPATNMRENDVKLHYKTKNLLRAVTQFEVMAKSHQTKNYGSCKTMRQPLPETYQTFPCQTLILLYRHISSFSTESYQKSSADSNL